MTNEQAQGFGFAPAHDAPIPYIQRIRDYYVALGYGAPYEWAHYAQVPFQPCASRWRRAGSPSSPRRRPISPTRAIRARALPTTRRPNSTPSIPATPPRTTTCASRHVGIDRKHTTAEDPGTWFPLPELRRAATRGRIGSVAPRFHGLPTNRSHRVTLEVDCPEIVARCRDDRRRCGHARRQLPRLPPEHRARRPRAGGGRHRHRGDGLRQGHRRACRRAAPAVLRLPARQSGGPAEGLGVASRSRSRLPSTCWSRRRPRAPPCSRRSSGAPAPTGSSTSRTSRACRPRRSPAAAPISTSRRRWPRACARTSACSATRPPPRRRPHDAALRRRPHPRFHAGVRRPLRLLSAGAARRRRRQDRAPRRGRHAPRPAQQGLVGPQPVDRVHGHQLQQALSRPRPHQAEGDRDRRSVSPPRPTW